jgi:hypothetical protein
MTHLVRSEECFFGDWKGKEKKLSPARRQYRDEQFAATEAMRQREINASRKRIAEIENDMRNR